MLGSMGLACPIALEGDGSILMALGCLATIGMVKPRNLTIMIMDNGVYQITGKQPAATANSADIVAIAGIAGGEDRRPRRHRADSARSCPHPPALHARARHRAQERAGRIVLRVMRRYRCSALILRRRRSRRLEGWAATDLGFTRDRHY
jgi:hypothetical protein